MLNSDEVQENIQINENNALNLRKLELNNLKILYQIMNDNNWTDIDFNITVPNIEKYKDLKINMFCFKDCMNSDITEAMKKLLKIGCQRAIKKREEFLNSYNQFMTEIK